MIKVQILNFKNTFVFKWILILVLLIHFNTDNSFASDNKTFNDPVFKQAYSCIFKFDLDSAQILISQIKKNNPSNISIYFLNSLIELFEIALFDDPELYENWKSQHSLRIRSLKNYKSENTAYQQFILAEMYLHSAILKFRFNEHISSAFDIRKSYRLHNSNLNLYPEFILSSRSFLMINAAIATIPEKFKPFAKFFGFETHLNSAINDYRLYLEKLNKNPEYQFFVNESNLLFAYANLYLLNDESIAWEYVSIATQDYETNPLSAFFRANIAINSGKNKHIESVLLNHTGKSDNTIPFNEYMMGLSKLYNLDVTALRYFANFIESYKGKNYIKDVYLKMGWAFLIKGDTTNYNNSVFLVKNKGNALIDKDKQALYEVKSNKIPNIVLLKARLSFDGGNYQKALEILKYSEYNEFTYEEKAEYTYRMGRIYHKLKQYNNALEQYKKYLNEFRVSRSYFGAASALHSGEIYEKEKNYEKAIYYYELSNTFKDHPYSSSMEQKANAAIKRIKK